jgi:hypothetical protein
MRAKWMAAAFVHDRKYLLNDLSCRGFIQDITQSVAFR